MNTPGWISSQVSKLLPNGSGKVVKEGRNAVKSGKKEDERSVAPVEVAQEAIKSIVNDGRTKTGAKAHKHTESATEKAAGAATGATDTLRSTRERLKGYVRHKEEALSPRVLRRTLEELKAIVDPQISAVEGGRRAQGVARWYASAPLEQRRDMWLLMSEQFVADPQITRQAQARFAAQAGTPDEAAAEVHYRRATVSPRRRLLQRISAFPEGIRFLVDLRADMLLHLKADKRLQALDVEMEYMFSTWFDVGFLDLKRISWDSPASLIEKLIKYEAVHDIKSWSDVKNRLDSDRRCYGFFHPRLPDDPLIFVEVAFTDGMADCITPLLHESADATDLKKAATAIFYSISNTQSGLRGVGFGDSLIKRVVETLKDEFPKLKHFATLSPIPGFRAWLGKNAGSLLDRLDDKARLQLAAALGGGTQVPLPADGKAGLKVDVKADVPATQFLSAADNATKLDPKSPVRKLMLQCAALYLGRELKDGKPLDPVARFHLGNGARVERLNWAGDPSAKGIKQSCGLMVNYLYDLKRLDKHRALLGQGKIAVSADIEALLK